MSSPVFVVATQRSGTNLLRSCLGTHPRVVDLDEVFHPAHSRRPESFYAFIQGKSIADRARPMSHEACNALFTAYTQHLGLLAPTATVLADVKYNSFFSITPVWHSASEPPYLLRMMLGSGHPIIHLIRSNPLRMVASELCAKQSGQYIVTADQAPQKVSLPTLEKGQLLNLLRRKWGDVNLFRKWLSGSSTVLEIRYEDLLEEGGTFNGELLSRIAQFVGVDDRFDRVPKTAKQGRALACMFQDFDAIRAHLVGTEFEEFADDS